MELFLTLVALGLIGWFIWPKAKKAADVNEDGKVNVEDAKAVVAKVEDAVVSEAKESAAELIKDLQDFINYVDVGLMEFV
jgi:hypothetical protein